jgi:uncharacterized membrane protein
MALGVVVVDWIVALWAYFAMPVIMVTHWGINGEPNGYSPKWVGVFLLPVLSLAIWGIFKVVPKMDPMWKNVKKFEDAYDQFVCGILEFLAFIYLMSLAWNLGIRFDFLRVLAVGIAGIYLMTGNLLFKTEQNWCIGVRTPWTLADPKVWKKTNTLAGKLFIVCGAISLLAIFWPNAAVGLMLVPILVASFGVYTYSYILYRKIKKD